MKPRIHSYADGGKVVGPKRTRKPPVVVRGDTAQSTRVGSTTDTLRNRRRAQEEALGLRDGGSVPPRKPLPPPSTRRMPPRSPMPPPEKGPKPKRIGQADGGRVKKKKRGGKVRRSY